MKKIGIFLHYGSLDKTIIESQVIAHVRDMSKAGVDMEVWSYAVTKKLYKENQKTAKDWSYRYNIPIRNFRAVRPGIPFSEILNAYLLKRHLNKENIIPTFIHCRTEYSASVAGFLKLINKFTLIWDCRGDTKNEFLLQRQKWKGIKKWLSFIKLCSIKFRIWWSLKQADKAIFVSDALKELHNNREKLSHRTTVIPCVASSEYFYFDEHLRSITRNKLHLEPSDTVFVYSGSDAPWQCFEETIRLIIKFIKQGSDFKAIILTPDTNKIRYFLEDYPRERIICLSVTLPQVNAYLNAADFGILLRRPGPINHVASPTKFAEYCLAGLRVITTNAVEQVNNFGTYLGNIVIYDFDKELILPRPFSNEERHKVAFRAKNILSREAIIDKYLRVYDYKYHI
ncbi:MAG TPA: glycosyltransferase family 4 protein [Tepidanaerobacter syntrophicus]|jgi:hypothetical protein|uniref:hypothetical protein n=1 Tax=Tepidanaerobacter syntrophicus TaxID=224999 RepID=UPI001756CE20|nr:hypothetical protein [Tepidanaerobacter syntrophicus]HHV82834.1 glycosyltransferase family 4 protein [Tepidanaerobacter syntrophicus]